MMSKTDLCLEAISSADLEPGWCPGRWDSLLCWPPTAPNTTAEQPCPSNYFAAKVQRNASRYCTESGTWFALNSSRPEQRILGWTNYSNCRSPPPRLPPVDMMNEDHAAVHEVWVPLIKIVSNIGYSVSLIALVLACVVLISFRRLHCPRNCLHLHLFASFILRAGTTLIKNGVMQGGLGLGGAVSDGSGRVDLDPEAATNLVEFPWTCKLLIAIWHFSLAANYAWILMEGLYLHNLIFLALFTDSSSIRLYALLGWSMPLGVVTIWIVSRALWDDAMCWTVNGVAGLVWILEAPILFSILINFVLFLNVSRVLLLKLRAGVSHETSAEGYKKWAKSTLVLVPLFGVNYVLLVGFEHAGKHVGVAIEIFWLLLDQFFASLQGFFVAILYCFMNGEVRTELGKKWVAWQEAQGPATRRLLGPDSRFRQPRPLGGQSCTLDIPGGSTAFQSFTTATDIHGDRSMAGAQEIHPLAAMNTSAAGGHSENQQCLMEVEIPGSNGEAGIPMVKIVKSGLSPNGSKQRHPSSPGSLHRV